MAAFYPLAWAAERQVAACDGLAAAQPVGLQEMFGSMTKSFHPGRAAQNGLFTSIDEYGDGMDGWHEDPLGSATINASKSEILAMLNQSATSK